MRITVAEVLQYYNCDIDSRIQVVLPGNDWDDAFEVNADANLFSPYMGCIVTDMRCEKSYVDGSPILRIGVDRKCYDGLVWAA